MKRGAPLKPGRGLAPGKGLQRGTEPLRRSAPIARTPMARKPASKPTPAARKTGASPEVRALVISRDAATCQRCGAPGTNVQHREGRGMGGRSKAEGARTNGPAWLVVVCGQGNTSGCHKALDDDREAAVRDGFVILRNGPQVDAAAVPVRTYLGLRLLTDDGRSIAA